MKLFCSLSFFFTLSKISIIALNNSVDYFKKSYFMKKKLFYVIIVNIICLVAGLSCNNSEMSAGNRDNIIGEWKLVKVIIPFTSTAPITYDYSQYNIVYKFNTNGIMTVFGETENIDFYSGHEIGEYSYSIIKHEDGFSLKIDNLTYGCRISSKNLEISYAFLDGNIYYLDKIN